MRFVFKNKRKIKNFIKNFKYEYKDLKDYKFLLSIIVIGLIFGGLFYFFEPAINENFISGYFTKTPVEKKIYFENLSLIDFLQNSEFIQDLPKDALISLEIGDEVFTIKGNEVEFGKLENPDIHIYLPKIYIDELENGLCYTTRKAKENRDLWIELYLSELELSWKYKGMLKHQACLI